MKIAMASTFAARCGISTYTLHLTSELYNQGARVCVAAENKDIPGYDDGQMVLTKVPFEWCFSRTDKTFDSIFEFVNDSEAKADILHIQHEGLIFGWDMKLPILLKKCKNAGIKSVVTLHSVPMDGAFLDWIDTNFVSDKIIVHTEAAFKQFAPETLNKHIVKINHGCIPLNTNIDKKALRTELKLDPEALYIATTGYIGDLKGFKEMIDILPAIKKEHPNAKLLYLGGVHPATKQFAAPYLADLARAMKQSDLNSSDVHITGWIPENQMSKYLLTPDLYVLNYKPSGVYSATGAGARIVGTRVPLLCAEKTMRLEELEDGKVCVKYPKDKMLETVLFMLKSKSFATTIAENAYQYALENSWENIAKQHMNLYTEIMK